MATYTPNFNLSKPEDTDTQSSFISDYRSNMDTIDANLGGGGGGNVYGAFIDTSRVITNYSSSGGSAIPSYTATEDCAISMYIFGKGSQTCRVYIDSVEIQTIYFQQDSVETPLLYLKQGQTISFSSFDYWSFHYEVYGLIQGTEGIFAPVIYSDTERKIGVWRDNKPLYQKTILVTSIVSGNNTINHGISNVDKIVKTFGTFFSNANNSSPIPNGNLQTAWSVSMFDFGTTNFTISVGSSWVQYFDYIQVTLQYTKTTDSAGSGNWNTDGIPMHHYSTNEQVIGTWIDGKPLYQRTWDFGSNITINSNAWTNTTISVAGNSIKAIINSKATNDGGTNYNFIACNTDQTYVQVLQTRNASIVVRYLTLEYTKSTD